MSEIIGSYQVTNFTTPVNGGSLDASVVLSNDNVTRTNHNSHDNDPGVHFQSSVLASRPAAGTLGRKWFTTDGLRVYYDTGAAWSEIDYLCKTAGGTVAGATTFSGGLTSSGATTLAAFTASGLATLNGGLTTTTGAFSGAVSMGALTATTGTFSGAVSMTGLTATTGTFSGAVSMTGLTATTGTFSGLVTANGGVLIGGGAAAAGAITKSAVGGLLINGIVGSSYDLLVNNPANSANLIAVPTGTQNVLFFGITLFGTTVTTNVSGAGAVKLAVGSGNVLVLEKATGPNLLFTTSETIRFSLAGLNAADGLDFNEGAAQTNRGRISGGILSWGTTVTTGAAAGDVVLKNGGILQGVNAAGTGTRRLLYIDGLNEVLVAGDGLSPIGLGAPAVLTGASAGDAVIGYNKILRSANKLGTGVVSLISLGNNTNADVVEIGPDGSGAITIGGATIVAGAGSSEMVMKNAKGLRGMNAAASTTKSLIQLNASDKVSIDADAMGAVFGAGAVFAGALSGITTLAMGGALSGVTTIAMSSTLTGATRVETGKLKGNSATPGITPNANLGTGGTASVSGTDLGGRITLTGGSAAVAASGIFASVTFNSAYSVAPVVLLTFSATNPSNVSNAPTMAINVTTTGFDIYSYGTPGIAGVWHVGYIVIAL